MQGVYRHDRHDRPVRPVRPVRLGEPMTSLISHVSDTARWVATYRALETESRNPNFRDPYARRLAGERGFAILDALPDGRRWAWPLITRTAVLDEMIQRTISEHQVDTVLNLAAGFDARPWRLPLPSPLNWIDADLPVMLDEKEQVMAGEKPACHYEAVRVDLADPVARAGLFQHIGQSARKALVLTEGLLIYLAPEDVASLARDLALVTPIRWWIMDLASPELLQRMEKNWAPVVRAGNAPFRFGPAENTGFFAPFGWREVEFRSTLAEAVRIKRAFPLGGLVLWLTRFAPPEKREKQRRFSGYALLERP